LDAGYTPAQCYLASGYSPGRYTLGAGTSLRRPASFAAEALQADLFVELDRHLFFALWNETDDVGDALKCCRVRAVIPGDPAGSGPALGAVLVAEALDADPGSQFSRYLVFAGRHES
jgi:hypothetical protein